MPQEIASKMEEVNDKICVEKHEDNDTEKEDLINNLDEDSLAQIFVKLSIAQRMELQKVCSKWKDATRQAWFDTQEYKFGISMYPGSNELLTQAYVEKSLSSFGIYLRELTLTQICDSTIMIVVGDNCINLKKFEFAFNTLSKINDTNHYIYAFTELEKLEYIRIEIVNADETNDVPFPFEIIDSLPEDMKEIHIIFNSREKCGTGIAYTPEDHIANFDLKRFTKLHSITLNSCNIDNLIETIADKPNLVHLDIQCVHARKDFLIFDKLVNLETINISNPTGACIYQLTNETVDSIIATCKNVKSLTLGYGKYQFDKIINKNWINLGNLVHLSICALLTLNLAEKLFHYCKKLKYLNLSLIKNKHIPKYALMKISDLPELEYLILPAMGQISRDAIISIANSCYKLKEFELHVKKVVQSRDRGPLGAMSTLEELAKLDSLERLNLEDIRRLEDNTLIAIAKECENLKYLNIEFCKNITEPALMSLTNLKNLETLFISNIPAVSDNFISQLKGLKSIKCCNCTNVTDVGLIQFIKNCPDLEHLEIFGIKFTIDTIIAADEETKNRTNGIILTIVTHDVLFAKEAMSKMTSSWINIR